MLSIVRSIFSSSTFAASRSSNSIVNTDSIYAKLLEGAVGYRSSGNSKWNSQKNKRTSCSSNNKSKTVIATLVQQRRELFYVSKLKQKHYRPLLSPSRSFATQGPTLKNDHSKMSLPFHGDRVGGDKEGHTTYGNESPINDHRKSYTYIGSTTFLLALVAATLAYLYCENTPDHELCASLRERLGIKKKPSPSPS